MQVFRLLFVIMTLLAAGPAAPHGLEGTATAMGSAPATAGATDLKFREMFRLPVGRTGLEPSQKLLRLDGETVRIIGYMVDQEQMRSFILAPLPLKLGEEDEGFADDLPPGVVFVHFTGQHDRVSRHVPGLLELTGRLSVGNFAETDGRVSAVRLTVDPAMSQEVSHHVRLQ